MVENKFVSRDSVVSTENGEKSSDNTKHPEIKLTCVGSRQIL